MYGMAGKSTLRVRYALCTGSYVPLGFVGAFVTDKVQNWVALSSTTVSCCTMFTVGFWDYLQLHMFEMVNYRVNSRSDCPKVEIRVQGSNLSSFWMIKWALKKLVQIRPWAIDCAELDWDSPGAIRTALLVTLLINQHLLKHLMDFNFCDSSANDRMQHMTTSWW